MHLIDNAYIRIPAGLVVRGGGFGRVDVGVRFGIIDRGSDGICLVDTGYGPTVTSNATRRRSMKFHNWLLSPRLVDGGQPLDALARLGKSPADVRTIVLTHFHPDHVANLTLFPTARILACGRAARTIETLGAFGRMRHGIFSELLPADLLARIEPIEACPTKPTWTRLDLGHDIFGDGSYLAIPLPGHALGHTGLLWREATGPVSNGPVCYAADATWTLQALEQNRSTEAARFVVFADRRAGCQSEARLRAFIAEGGTVRLCHEIRHDIRPPGGV